MRYFYSNYRKDPKFVEQYNVINDILNDNISAVSDYNKRIAFEVLGPLILGYTCWLHDSVKKSGINKIFFFSREGKLLKKVYDTLYNDTQTHYMYVSRLALSRAFAIETKNFDELYHCFIASSKYVTTLYDFLEIIGLSNYKKEFAERMDCSVKINECDDIIKKVFFNTVMNFGGKYFELQNNSLVKYLVQIGFNGRVAVSDVGWAGSMQFLLYSYVKNVDIDGFYFGVNDLRNLPMIKRHGFWFESFADKSEEWKFRLSLSVIETLLTSTECTLLSYFCDEDESRFEYGENECNAEVVNIINKVHGSVIEFINCLKQKNVFDEYYTFRPDVTLLGYERFALYPDHEMIDFFKTVSFIDGEKMNNILPEHNLMYYIFHPRRMIKEFENNISKIIWMKEVFKIRLPYAYILRWLMNIKETEYAKKLKKV